MSIGVKSIVKFFVFMDFLEEKKFTWFMLISNNFEYKIR